MQERGCCRRHAGFAARPRRLSQLAVVVALRREGEVRLGIQLLALRQGPRRRLRARRTASGSASAPPSPARTCCTRCSTARRKQRRATARPSRSAPTARPRRTTRLPRRKSISGWEIDTSKKYGKEWAVWDKAGDTDIDCHKVGDGQQCIAVGTPCKVGLARSTAQKKRRSRCLDRRFLLLSSSDRLDDVDLGRQVRRDLEANFLLTNCGLCPNLHSFLL